MVNQCEEVKKMQEYMASMQKETDALLAEKIKADIKKMRKERNLQLFCQPLFFFLAMMCVYRQIAGMDAVLAPSEFFDGVFFACNIGVFLYSVIRSYYLAKDIKNAKLLIKKLEIGLLFHPIKKEN